MNRAVEYCYYCQKINPEKFKNGNCRKCHNAVHALSNGPHVVNWYGHKCLVVSGDVSGDYAIPEGVEDIYSLTLNSTSIRSIHFPQSMKTIPRFCCSHCRSLKEVYIPNSVTAIKWQAFDGCISLTEIVIPPSVTLIEEETFRNCTALQKVVINGDVKIDPSAFQGCHNIKIVVIDGNVGKVFANGKNIEQISLGPNVKVIGSQAFAGVRNQIIDLPENITEIAPDAFGEGCVISVAGEMPFYHARKEALDKTQQEIEAKKALILELQGKIALLEEEYESHVYEKSTELSSVSQNQQQVRYIEQRIEDIQRDVDEKQNAINAQIAQLERKIVNLTEQRRKCFFLAISKKKELDASIESNQNEQRLLRNGLVELQRTYNQWTGQKNSLMDKISNNKIALQTKKQELSEMEAAFDQRHASLEQEHTQWKENRDALILRKQQEEEAEALRQQQEKEAKALRLQREKEAKILQKKRQALITQKENILAAMKLPKRKEIPQYTYKTDKSIVEKNLLNEAFLEALHDWIHAENATVHNQFVKEHANDITTVKKINSDLGCAEDDGISHYCTMEVPPQKTNYIPKRFDRLVSYFSKTSDWKAFKQACKKNACPKRPNVNYQDKFFAGCDYFVFASPDKSWLMFPYCIIKYSANKALEVYTYDTVNVEVNVVCRTETGDTAPKYGEFIGTKYMHQNKDGSPSRRYSYNPLVKEYRFTSIAVSIKGNKNANISIPFDTYNDALQFESAFYDYVNALTEGEFHGIYKAIQSSANLEAIEIEIQHYNEAEKKRIAEEKMRIEEEKKRIEEEKQQAEAVRLAAQAAAEERRKVIIQRQKELNEERKRQAAEKQKIYSLFEEESIVDEQAQEDKVITSAAPLEIIGERTISNNVFKVNAKQVVPKLEDETVCYFVAENGSSISNRKKLANGGMGGETTVGFVLVSGIDYTQMSSCLMRIESNGEVQGEIRFKLNISFYSDF